MRTSRSLSFRAALGLGLAGIVVAVGGGQIGALSGA